MKSHHGRWPGLMGSVLKVGNSTCLVKNPSGDRVSSGERAREWFIIQRQSQVWMGKIHHGGWCRALGILFLGRPSSTWGETPLGKMSRGRKVQGALVSVRVRVRRVKEMFYGVLHNGHGDDW